LAGGPIAFHEEGSRRAVSMEKGVRICSNLKRTFPGMLNLTHKPIPATLTHDQGDLFIDIFLQLLGIHMLHLLKQVIQLLINVSWWLSKNPIET
jgi:hypothetical protein